MNLRIGTTVLIATIAMAGCGGSKIERPGLAYGCPIGEDQKISSKEDLIKAKIETAGTLYNIEFMDLRCAERAGGILVDADLRNNSRELRRIAYRFRWLDKDGMRAWDDESWKPLLIPGKTLYTITTRPPTPEATDFRLVVMDQDQ